MGISGTTMGRHDSLFGCDTSGGMSQHQWGRFVSHFLFFFVFVFVLWKIGIHLGGSTSSLGPLLLVGSSSPTTLLFGGHDGCTPFRRCCCCRFGGGGGGRHGTGCGCFWFGWKHVRMTVVVVLWKRRGLVTGCKLGRRKFRQEGCGRGGRGGGRMQRRRVARGR